MNAARAFMAEMSGWGDPDGDGGDLRAARGIIEAVAGSLLLWAAILVTLWWLWG
jgi:hypothetical protein